MPKPREQTSKRQLEKSQLLKYENEVYDDENLGGPDAGNNRQVSEERNSLQLLRAAGWFNFFTSSTVLLFTLVVALSAKCGCENGTGGGKGNCKNFKPLPTSCVDVENVGCQSGIYNISIKSRNVQVLCEKGWMYIQKRVNGKVDFYKSWEKYARGFGKLDENFWLGLQNINDVTIASPHRIRIDLEGWDGERKYAEYSSFTVKSAADKYRLIFNGHSGTASPDGFSASNEQPFTTYDQDNDKHRSKNCAKEYHGAWWYASPICTFANLNGLYRNEPEGNKTGIFWHRFNRLAAFYSLKQVSMKLRPV